MLSRLIQEILFVISYSCCFELRIQMDIKIKYQPRFHTLKGKCWDSISERLLEGSQVISTWHDTWPHLLHIYHAALVSPTEYLVKNELKAQSLEKWNIITKTANQSGENNVFPSHIDEIEQECQHGILFINFIINICMCCIHACVLHACLVHLEWGEYIGWIPWNWNSRREPQFGCWEPNLAPLEEHQRLLTSESPLQAYAFLYILFFWLEYVHLKVI